MHHHISSPESRPQQPVVDFDSYGEDGVRDGQHIVFNLRRPVNEIELAATIDTLRSRSLYIQNTYVMPPLLNQAVLSVVCSVSDKRDWVKGTYKDPANRGRPVNLKIWVFTSLKKVVENSPLDPTAIT